MKNWSNILFVGATLPWSPYVLWVFLILQKQGIVTDFQFDKDFFGYSWSFYWTNKLRYRKLPIKHSERLFSNRSFCVGACLNWLLNRARMFIKKMKKLRLKKYQTSKFLTKSQNPFQNSFQNWSKLFFLISSNERPVWTECVFGLGCL